MLKQGEVSYQNEYVTRYNLFYFLLAYFEDVASSSSCNKSLSTCPKGLLTDCQSLSLMPKAPSMSVSTSTQGDPCHKFQKSCPPLLFFQNHLTWPKYFNLGVMTLSMSPFSPTFISVSKCSIFHHPGPW